MEKIVEVTGLELSVAPVDSNAAGQTGDRYNLRDFRRIGWLILQGVWAAGPAAVTVLQHDAVTAGNSKALSFTKAWTKVGLVDAAWTELLVVSDTFDLPAVADTMTFVEIDAATLDTDNDFVFVSLDVASPGAGAALISIGAVLKDPRYAGEPAVHLPNPKV